MNKTTSTLAIAAAACALLGGTAPAQRAFSETVEVPVTRLEPKTRVLSGETLAGRREVIAEDATIIDDGARRRALIRRGDDIETPRVNRFLGPGAELQVDNDDDEVEVELEVDD